MIQLLLLSALFAGAFSADQLLYRVQQPLKDQTVLCPDQTSKCPQGFTCCLQTTGKFGCCPFSKAICCTDKVHCCPQSYTCHADKRQCVKAINNETIPWAQKQPSSVSSSSLESPPPPGNDLKCPDGTTCAGTSSCCRTYSGKFRCCPFPNTVCCSDGQACCPRCTICDFLNNRCLSGFTTEQWKPLIQSTPATIPDEEEKGAPAEEKSLAVSLGNALNVEGSPGNIVEKIFCNRTHFCYDWQSCCQLPGGLWGCCPYIHATCCSGSIYCCPAGKRCSYPAGRCYG